MHCKLKDQVVSELYYAFMEAFGLREIDISVVMGLD